jgi:paraquat-inducible protein A
MKNSISIIFLSLFTGLLLYFALNAYFASLKYEEEFKKYANSKTIEKSLENNTKTLFSNLLLSLIEEEPIQRNNEVDEFIVINKYATIVQINLQYFIIVLLLSFFVCFFTIRIIMMIYIHLVSFISLYFGLTSPIFLMYIEKNLVGSNVILQYESSTILSSIEKLFLQDNYFVGGIILLFSIIFPLFKSLLTFLTIFIQKYNKLNKISNLSSLLAKFSMADVFVLSIFLVYLSPKEDGIIKTNLELGFYFFFLYVILSLFISLFTKLNNK